MARQLESSSRSDAITTRPFSEQSHSRTLVYSGPGWRRYLCTVVAKPAAFPGPAVLGSGKTASRARKVCGGPSSHGIHQEALCRHCATQTRGLGAASIGAVERAQGEAEFGVAGWADTDVSMCGKSKIELSTWPLCAKSIRRCPYRLCAELAEGILADPDDGRPMVVHWHQAPWFGRAGKRLALYTPQCHVMASSHHDDRSMEMRQLQL